MLLSLNIGEVHSELFRFQGQIKSFMFVNTHICKFEFLMILVSVVPVAFPYDNFVTDQLGRFQIYGVFFYR